MHPTTPEPSHRSIVVAIDGPAGTGKSTVARGVAARLGLRHLDTGAMYRAITFAALRRRLDPDDADAVGRLAAEVDLHVSEDRVEVDGVDATIEIRGPEVTRAVSAVAANPVVRQEMRRRQREWIAANGGGVVEGRDIGTVVAPDADVKVFLTAASEVRAARRHREVKEADYEDVAAELTRRDTVDESRTDSPTRAADDAAVIDTTDLEVHEVIALVLKLL